MADDFGPMPTMKTQAVGHGLGKKDFGILNFLRIFLGETEGVADEVSISEANLDDMTPEAVAYAADRSEEHTLTAIFRLSRGFFFITSR